MNSSEDVWLTFSLAIHLSRPQNLLLKDFFPQLPPSFLNIPTSTSSSMMCHYFPQLLPPFNLYMFFIHPACTHKPVHHGSPSLPSSRTGDLYTTYVYTEESITHEC